MSAKVSRSVLLYHLYLKNNWKEVTTQLLTDVPHTDIYIHVAYNGRRDFAMLPFTLLWLKRRFKIKMIFISKNNPQYGECIGFEKFRKYINWEQYDIGTYIHSKGVTKPDSKPVADWRELMRYFVIERMDLCVKAFEERYALYGVNLFDGKGRTDHAFAYAPYLYRGNFVSFNLRNIRAQFLETRLDFAYYGVEGFWGKLCGIDAAFNVFESGVAHYEQEFPEEFYKQPSITVQKLRETGSNSH